MDGREQARRAYERGRLRFAAVRGGGPALVFGMAACIAASGPSSAVMSVLLGVAAFAMVFAGGPAGRAVPSGFLAGALAFVLPLVVRGQICPLGGSCDTWCLAACTAGGLLSGAWLGWRSASEPGGAWWLVAGLALAMAAGSLGCACAGIPGVVGMGLGAFAAAPMVRLLARA